MKSHTPNPNYGPGSYNLDLDVNTTAMDYYSAVINLLVVIPAAFLFKILTLPMETAQRFTVAQNKKTAAAIIPKPRQRHM